MQRNRVVLLALAAVVIVAGFVLASGGRSANSKPKLDTFTVRVLGGKPSGGVAQLAASKKDTVQLTVQSDVADEIHLHGYDYKKPVSAGGSVNFSFRATITGVFVVELESRNEQIASLKVTA